MSDAIAPSALRPRRSKLLIASLAFNLLALGLIGGATFARFRFQGPAELNIGKILGDPGLRGFARTLPPERHATLRARGDQFRQTMKPLRQAAQTARLEAIAALNA